MPGENARAWATVAVLALLYVLSFIDRFILALLVAPLQRDLGLSDVQLGVLFGTAFGVFYGVLGIPIARLADRVDRKKLIIAGVLIWSSCTILTGLANSFLMIALLRIGLAVGEAALAPAAYSMIADMFAPERRGLPTMIFTATSLTGPSLTYLLGAIIVAFAEGLFLAGQIGDLREWQFVFFLVGAPGLVLVSVLALVAREPVRGDGGTAAPGDYDFRALLAYLRCHFWLYAGLFGAAGFTSMIYSTMMAWSPTFLERSFGWSTQQSGFLFGMMLLVSSGLGALTVPLLAPLLNRSGRCDGVVRVAILMASVTFVLVSTATVSGSPVAFLILLGGAIYCIAGNTTNILVALQTIAPPRMRATLVALNLACISVFGLGFGPPLAALISKLYSGFANPLAYSIATLAAACAAVALLLLIRALTPFRVCMEELQSHAPTSN